MFYQKKGVSGVNEDKKIKFSDKENSEVEQARKNWEVQCLYPLLQQYPEKKERFNTTSGITIDRLYSPDQVTINYLSDLNLPGKYPFTRGIQPTGYRGKVWTFRPITGFGSAKDTNSRFKKLIQLGQTGLHFVFDYPTLACIGSESPLAEGEVGRDGIPMNTLADMETLLDGINLEEISTSWSSWGPVIFSMLVAVADKRGVKREKLTGTLQNDVLMYYHSCPWFDLPLKANMKLFVDVVEFAVKHMPRWNVVSISGYNIREGGCSAAQEIAFTFGDAIAYANACIERGLSPDDFLPRFSFHLCSHNDFFEEICKMRAMRRMWSKITRYRLGAKNPRSWMFRFHTQTAGSTLTMQQPYNNVIRGTVQALTAVLGGTQSLHVSCFDEAYGLPSEQAAGLSVNVQNILAHENGITSTIDPLGGSYYIEDLTTKLEENAWSILEQIDEQGGMVEAALKGWIQQEKNKYGEDLRRKIESCEQVIVGVNKFVDQNYESVIPQPISMDMEKAIKEELAELKSRRDNRQVASVLNSLRRICQEEDNVVEAVIDAVKSYATLGEIYSVFREVYGEMSSEEMLKSAGISGY